MNFGKCSHMYICIRLFSIVEINTMAKRNLRRKGLISYDSLLSIMDKTKSRNLVSGTELGTMGNSAYFPDSASG